MEEKVGLPAVATTERGVGQSGGAGRGPERWGPMSSSGRLRWMRFPKPPDRDTGSTGSALPAEVGRLELRVGAEFLALALHHNAAGLEDVSLGGNFEGQVRVLLDE